MQVKKSIIFIICIFLGITTSLALLLPASVLQLDEWKTYLTSYNNDSQFDIIFAQIRYFLEYSGGLTSSLLSIGLAIYYYFYLRKVGIKKRGDVLTFAALLSFLMLLGNCYKSAGNIQFIIKNIKYFLFAMYKLFGYFILLYSLIDLICIRINQIKFICEDEKTNIFDKHTFIISFILLMVCWSPYLISYWPGVVNWDGLRQLDFYLGSLKWTRHHPVFSTLIFGYLFDIGKFVGGSDNFGFFLYILFQYVCSGFTITCGLSFLQSLNIKKSVTILIFGYFALFPVWGIYNVTYVKDTLYYVAFLFWTLLILKGFSFSFETISIKYSICLIASSLFVSGLRNNGIYVVFFSLLAILSICKRNRKRVAIIIASVLMIHFGYNNIYVPYVGIEDGSIREVLSIPFQQTARFVKEHPDLVSDNEEKVIDSILDFDNLGSVYNPDLSDPVKGSKHTEITGEVLTDYFSVWLDEFKKAPLTYIESFLNGTYGYWYLDKEPYKNQIGDFGHVTDPYVVRGNVNFHFNDFSINARNILKNLSYIILNLPIIGLLYYPSLYTWILLFVGFLCIKKKKPIYTVCLFPAFLSILVNMASPVNGGLRYTLPVMAIVPFISVYVLSVLNKKDYNDE